MRTTIALFLVAAMLMLVLVVQSAHGGEPKGIDVPGVERPADMATDILVIMHCGAAIALIERTGDAVMVWVAPMAQMVAHARSLERGGQVPALSMPCQIVPPAIPQSAPRPEVGA